jgi:hypothetical protein
MIKRFTDIQSEIEELRNKGIIRGDSTGFDCLDKIYSIKQGSYTIILGAPTHGKSELIMELCINQAIHYGKITLLCSPETGSVPEIFAELIHKYTGKSIYKTNANFLDDKQFYLAMEWVNHHFLIVDTDEKSNSIPELFDYCLKWEKENGQKISLVVGEPYNELRHDMEKYGTRQDLYIEDLMGQVRRFCKRYNKHFFLSIHPAQQHSVTKDGITYYPQPLPREAAGGQALFRKAMTWITLWRPPVGLNNASGWAYKDNELIVSVDKAKPKGVSNKGFCSLFFEWRKNRYYEDFNGDDSYAWEHLDNPPLFQINNSLPISDRF